MDIDELIRDLDWRNPRLVETLMLAYYDFIYRIAVSFLCDPDEASDAAQETFLQAAQHLDQYQPGTSIKNWLITIVVNVCRRRYRMSETRRRLQQILGMFAYQAHTNSLTPEDLVIAKEKKLEIQKAVDLLDNKHRMPLLLRYVHGMTVPEIAAALDLNEGTVYSRLHYAHKKLHNYLGHTINLPEQEGEEQI